MGLWQAAMLRKQCQRLADQLGRGNGLEGCQKIRTGGLRANGPLSGTTRTPPCSGCPFYLAARGPCALYSTCPVFQQQPTNSFSSSTAGGGPLRTCYCCATPLDADMLLQCLSCRRIQPRQHLALNHFELLQDGRVAFEIDRILLRRRFLDLQRILHPDKFVGHLEESAKAADWSAHLNGAYETLRSNVRRAIYLYNLLSPCPYEEETSGSTLSQAELMEILEVRERIEGCSSKEESAAILADTQEAIDRIIRALTAAFREGNLERQRHLIDRLRFMHSILEAAETRHEAS